MPLTEQDRAWHETYEQLTPQAKGAVDNAAGSLGRYLLFAGFRAAEDDRAEALVAAITRYLVLSNPHLGPDSILLQRQRGAPEPTFESGLDRRLKLRETAIAHKDRFGTAATKKAILEVGHSKSLTDVVDDRVVPLTRHLQAEIDRSNELGEAYVAGVKANAASGQVVGMRPSLAHPYGQPESQVRRSDNMWSSDNYYQALIDTKFLEPDKPEKPTGHGGSFDGGGASGNYDASPSSSDPSPSSND